MYLHNVSVTGVLCPVRLNVYIMLYVKIKKDFFPFLFRMQHRV